MALVEEAAAVVAAIAGLEVAKVLWHGRLQGNAWLVVCHAAIAACLGAHVAAMAWGSPWAIGAAAGVAYGVVWESRLALDSKRRGERLGSWLSGLSSYPVELAALVATTWSCWPWGLLAWPVVLYLVVSVWMSPLRPEHWPASRWEPWLGWMHPYWRRSR